MLTDSLFDKEYTHVSWISNISGRLFFHLTDAYAYRYDRIVGDVLQLNKKQKDTRIFFISMLADLRDEKKSTYSKKNSDGIDSEYTRIIISSNVVHSSCNPKEVKGKVYFIDSKGHTGLYKNKDENNFISKLDEYIKNDNPYQELQHIINEFVEKYSNESNYVIKIIDFKINEAGFVYLKEIDFEGHKVHRNTKVNADVQMAFFLLKFTFHKDRYHSTSRENIIRVIPYLQVAECMELNKNCQSKDLIISKLLLDGVKKYISEKRKLKVDYQEFSDLKGVINYAKTLTITLTKTLNVPNNQQGSQKTDDNQVKDFIEYEQDYLTNIESTLDRELEKMPEYTAKSLVNFFKELKILLFLPLLFMTVAFLSLRYLNITMNETHFRDIVNIYILIIIVGVLSLELIRAMKYPKGKTYFIEPILVLPKQILIFIKKHSNPNNSKGYEIFQKYICPKIIDTEMKIRRDRTLKYLYSILIFRHIFTIVIIISLASYIYLNNSNLKFEIPNIFKNFYHLYMDSTNKTTLKS